jgi:hypothetical protein
MPAKEEPDPGHLPVFFHLQSSFHPGDFAIWGK